MYKTIINGEQELSFENQNFDWDLLEVKEGYFHIVQNNKSYTASVLEANHEDKTFKIRINQEVYSIELKDKFDLLVEKLGLTNMNAQKANDVKAPMPGLVLDVLVKEGDEVAKGDSVLILEAMKMENVIKAAGDGVVQKISVDKGAAVEKNQVLVEFS
ncbi:MAG: biotin/lipoyl-binding protein [Aureispira sp.]|nr:biotin/lipoyl-binding protein [Aureispira sp.]